MFKPSLLDTLHDYTRQQFTKDLLSGLMGGSKLQTGARTGIFIVSVLGMMQQHGINGLTVADLLVAVMLIMMALL